MTARVVSSRLFFDGSGDRRDLHSFPTRRSSDLAGTTSGRRCARSPSAARPCCSRRTISKRSEEHTSELQSHVNIVCRLLLEKKKKGRRSDKEHRNRRMIAIDGQKRALRSYRCRP